MFLVSLVETHWTWSTIKCCSDPIYEVTRSTHNCSCKKNCHRMSNDILNDLIWFRGLKESGQKGLHFSILNIAYEAKLYQVFAYQIMSINQTKGILHSEQSFLPATYQWYAGLQTFYMFGPPWQSITDHPRDLSRED